MELSLVEALVDRAGAEQLGMGADGFDTALVDNHNAIGNFQGVEAVGNDQSSSIAHELLQGSMNQRLIFSVGGAGKFVQNQDARIAKDRAGQGDALSLAAGKLGAGFTDLGLITVRQAHDKFMDVGFIGSGFDFFLARPAIAVGNIVVDRVVEQDRFLSDDADLLSQASQVQMTNVQVIHQNGAVIRIVEARDKADQGRFATAILADQGHGFSETDFQVHVGEDGHAGLIGK